MFITVLGYIVACKNSSKPEPSAQKGVPDLNTSIYSEPLNIPTVDQSRSDLEKITYIEKAGEIKDGFSGEEYNFFAQITDLSIDRKDNLYVADSKLHRIFKFNKNGEFISSFGREGQGPGEFTGRLRMSVGDDNKIIITDIEGSKISIYSARGEFIRQFFLPGFTNDEALANSQGDIFLLSEGGFYVIDRKSSSLKHKNSFLGLNYHLNFSPIQPTSKLIFRMSKNLSFMSIHKLISDDDHLYVVFNNSQIVVHLDQQNKILYQFRIDHQRFVGDFKNRLLEAKKNGKWINCFGSVFIDNNNHICLCYYNNSLGLPEIYRYQYDGRFIDTIRTKNLKIKSNKIIRACDSQGNFYGIEKEASQISIYRINRNLKAINLEQVDF